MSTQALPQQNVPAADAWIGIDVAKKKLDVHLLLPDASCHTGVFENTSSGYTKLIKWRKRLASKSVCHFCLEATGSYSLGVAIALAEAGERVSIVNPHRAKCFAHGDGADNKNDKIDARTLARMCREKRPDPWRVPSGAVRELISLSRYLEDLVGMKTQQSNRLGEPGLSDMVTTSLTHMIEQIDEQIAEIEQAILALIDQHPDLRAKKDLLVTIPGIAERSAARFIAEIPDIEAFSSAPSLVRHAGLNPIEHQSGTSIRHNSQIARKGNRHLRTCLYMPALVAVRHNPLVRPLYERLCAAGKKKKVALVAAMRKLLSIIYGVLHHGKPFDASLVAG